MIFHLMTPEGWAAFEAVGASEQSTRDLTLAEEGFIHCSYAGQVDATLDRYYADLAEVVVLTLDPELLGAEVRVENGYPHVYGPLPLTAVVDVERRPPG